MVGIFIDYKGTSNLVMGFGAITVNMCPFRGGVVRYFATKVGLMFVGKRIRFSSCVKVEVDDRGRKGPRGVCDRRVRVYGREGSGERLSQLRKPKVDGFRGK